MALNGGKSLALAELVAAGAVMAVAIRSGSWLLALAGLLIGMLSAAVWRNAGGAKVAPPGAGRLVVVVAGAVATVGILTVVRLSTDDRVVLAINAVVMLAVIASVLWCAYRLRRKN
ncbi:hypothetical protein HPO96_03715 [Kribbella sandramycini]|uniref:Putative membrane protein n=1 Tax=Kribbella sandramycini TaxID=60450 RepID=A0A7Y4KX77_9ACTN|nr:hypothetical protein [Kribbella sandramycini]MBB6568060.1 putative membrane protein [Kribbella sandramycini]NOL39346.1 hypothetical protein [Kribbella sandramycini]